MRKHSPGVPVNPAEIEPVFSLAQNDVLPIDDGPMVSTGENTITDRRLKLSKTKTARNRLFLEQANLGPSSGETSFRLSS
jgi:hypothetical protein